MFSGESILKKHEKEAHEEGEYWCKIYKEPFSRRKSLWNHMVSLKKYKFTNKYQAIGPLPLVSTED